MNTLLLATLLTSVLITASGILVGIKSPRLYLKYFSIFFALVLSLSFGGLFWNMALLSVDKILIYKLGNEEYNAVWEMVRGLMFPAGMQSFILIQIIPLVVLYRKAKNSLSKA